MNWTGLSRTSAPVIEPVTRDQAKLHCRIDHDEEDYYIDDLIQTARIHCEGFQRRAYNTQSWRLAFDRWPGRIIELPRPPLQSITAISYLLEGESVPETIDSDDYIVDTSSLLPRIILKRDHYWPTEILESAAAITVDYVAGYGDLAADVPVSVKRAMLLLIGHWYTNRESVVVGQVSSELKTSVEDLLWHDRVVYA